MKARTHHELTAWQEAMALVELAYAVTRGFPKDELFGLTSQIRRSAVSIPSNIAEGAARNSTREFLQFMGVTCGSFAELDTQLELAVRLGYFDRGHSVIAQARRVGVLVRLLRRSLYARLR
jgi:four helix bundle protein